MATPDSGSTVWLCIALLAVITGFAADGVSLVPQALARRSKTFPQKRFVQAFTSRFRGNALTCRESGRGP